MKTRECPNLTGDNHRGLLVIGRDVDLSKDELKKLDNICAEVRFRYDIKTFDRIYNESKNILDNILKYFE